jgi:group I intron endonuclease
VSPNNNLPTSPRHQKADVSSGVYFIRHLASGKVYVGSSVTVAQRLNRHLNELRRGVHPNEYLQRAFTLHGEAAFESGTLEVCERDARLAKEQEWIDRLSSSNEDRGYNLIPTRASQLYGAALSAHQKRGWAALTREQRQQIAKHLRTPEMKARSQALANVARATPEHRKMRQAIAARTLTTEATRRKNSERLTRLWQDPTFRAQRIAGLDRGRATTNAARRKSAAQFGDDIV